MDKNNSSIFVFNVIINRAASNDPEERTSHLLRSGSLELQIINIF